MSSDEESYHYSDEDMADGDDAQQSDEEEYQYESDDDDGNAPSGKGGDDQSDFVFSSADENSADDLEVAVENAYYNAKGLRDTDLTEAAVAFEDVIVKERSGMMLQEQEEESGGGGGSGSAAGASSGEAGAEQPKVLSIPEMKEGDDEEEPAIYGPWSYKAIKQLVKLHLLRTGNRNEMMRQYHRLLRCIVASTSSSSSSGGNNTSGGTKSGGGGGSSSTSLSQNAIEKGISGILERASQAAITGGSVNNFGGGGAGNNSIGNGIDKSTLKEMYDATLSIFRPGNSAGGGAGSTYSCSNERLWFKTNLKLGQLLYEMNETSQLQDVIRDLLRGGGNGSSNSGGGGGISEDATMTDANDPSNTATTVEQRYAGTHLLEIYALQIQLYSRQKDTKKLRELFHRAMRVEGGIPHPRTIALIQELGGKMHMASREFENAGKTFFQAFKSYDEAGDPSRLRCLKYLVMASMLHASTINPFDSQEARPYKDDPEIVAMTNLVAAFHANEITKFEAILRKNEGKIMDDEFVREHLADLLRTIRTQVLQQVIAPYTKLSLAFIARELNDISVDEVEKLLVSLILDGKLHGKIDQVRGILLKGRGSGGTAQPPSTGGGGPAVAVVDHQSSSGGSSSAATAAGGGVGATMIMSSMIPQYLDPSSMLEARNARAIEQLTLALDQLTSGITGNGGRFSQHQLM